MQIGQVLFIDWGPFVVQRAAVFGMRMFGFDSNADLYESVFEVLPQRLQGRLCMEGWGLKFGGHRVNKILSGAILMVIIIMADLQEGLVTGRGKKTAQQQKKRFEECELKIKTLRNKNNQLQKQCDNQLESDIKMALRSQTSLIDHEIKQLRTMLEQLSKDFADPPSKKRIKEYCSQASKEMERNKRIMAEFLNRASGNYSYYKRESTAYRKSRTEFENELPPNKERRLPAVRESSSLIASEDMLSDLKAEQQMAAERTALIKQLQEKNNKINQIINEMGSLVGGQQRDMVEELGDNLRDAQHNVGMANEELDEAIVYQKKSKKKYICIVATIIILLAIAGGMVYFLVSK